ALKTLWFNTGTLGNITCRNCYIESSPKNDRLVDLGFNDLRPYLHESSCDGLGTEEIGVTGGELLMEPNIIGLLKECLLYQNSQTLTHAAGVLPGHPLQKRTEVQWDIGTALGADDGADESTSPQVGITRLLCARAHQCDETNAALERQLINLK